ncbi:MAG: DDE-type integrase/transposase/recombinase [Pseudorhodoplanes sp.]|jgi:putative transposase|nr:DDE-type integrase/transposase/recombinase [Pseudorhodoplanes sp.]
MNVPLIRLAKGDAIIIDNAWYEEIDRTRDVLTLKQIGGTVVRTFTGEELRDLYFDPAGRMRIERHAPKLLEPALADAVSRAFESFTKCQQQEMLLRLDYVKACDRFFGRKLFPKRLHGYERIATIVARYRRLVQARDQGLEPCQVPLELISGATLRDWHLRWRQAGRLIGALAPLHHLKGNRKGKLDPAVKAIIAGKIKEKWLTLEAPPVTVVHDSICREIRKLNDEGHFPAFVEPSEAAVRRWIADNVDSFTQVFYREGRKKAEDQFRLINRAPIATRPLQIVEFDETPLDIILVDEDGRPRGRAYLTVGICEATCMIVGWHIGYERASWTTIMQAIRMTISKKDTSGSGAESPFPVYGVPEIIKVDNGPQFRSTSLVAAAGQLQFEVRFVPAGKPHLKGKVERFFLEVTRDFLSVFPGRTFSNVEQRGDYDSSGYARMTLEQLQKLFMRWVVDIYHNRPNSRAFGQTPLERWQALSGCGVRLPPEVDCLVPLMGMVVHRTIQKAGIIFMGLEYRGPQLKLFKQRDGHLGRQWMVKIDPLDLYHVFVLDEQKGKWEAIACQQPELIEGLTLRMWMDVVELARKRTKENQRVSRAILLKAREALLREAEAMGHKPRGKITEQDYRWMQARLDVPDYDISIDPTDPDERPTKNARRKRKAESFSDPALLAPASEAGGHPLSEVASPNPFDEAQDRAFENLNEEQSAIALSAFRQECRQREDSRCSHDPTDTFPIVDLPSSADPHASHSERTSSHSLVQSHESRTHRRSARPLFDDNDDSLWGSDIEENV